MENYETPNAINEAIAENLKKIRRDRHLSLDHTSELTGVSKSMLGQIERGESSPTISTLWKIATGLHVPFASLLERPEESTVIIRNSELTPITSDQDRFRLYPVFPSGKGRNLDICYLELDPGAVAIFQPRETDAEEFLLLFGGQLEVLLNRFALYQLEEGTSMHYRANQHHQFQNPGSSTARLCLIIRRPSGK